MKLSINTNQLQNLVTKAIKGASDNKLLPMTSLMSIDYDGAGKLSLTTTDMTNYLTVATNDASQNTDELHVVVIADSFAKLVSKMTSETIEIDFTDNTFTLSGGKSNYKLELPLDVDGSLIKLQAPEVTGKSEQTIKLTSVKNILSTAKASLATSLAIPCYTAYYVGDEVLSTDSLKICCIKDKLLKKPALIRADTMDLLDIAESDLKCVISDSAIKFETEDGVFALSTKVFDGLEVYSVDAINGLVDLSFESECTLYKNDLLQALDRLALFVDKVDRNVINMSFGKDKLVLTNKAQAGVEEIDYASESEAKDFECTIDIEMLISQIKATPDDKFTMYYGLDNCIKIVNEAKDIIQIISLLDD